MAVDHGSFIHVRAYIDVHRRHAHDARRDIRAIPNAGSTRNYAHVITDGNSPDRVSIFIEETKAVSRHINQPAHAKANQNPLFHPCVYLPRSVTRTFGRAYLAAIQG